LGSIPQSASGVFAAKLGLFETVGGGPAGFFFLPAAAAFFFGVAVDFVAGFPVLAEAFFCLHRRQSREAIF